MAPREGMPCSAAQSPSALTELSLPAHSAHHSLALLTWCYTIADPLRKNRPLCFGWRAEEMSEFALQWPCLGEATQAVSPSSCTDSSQTTGWLCPHCQKLQPGGATQSSAEQECVAGASMSPSPRNQVIQSSAVQPSCSASSSQTLPPKSSAGFQDSTASWETTCQHCVSLWGWGGGLSYSSHRVLPLVDKTCHVIMKTAFSPPLRNNLSSFQLYSEVQSLKFPDT